MRAVQYSVLLFTDFQGASTRYRLDIQGDEGLVDRLIGANVRVETFAKAMKRTGPQDPKFIPKLEIPGSLWNNAALVVFFFGAYTDFMRLMMKEAQRKSIDRMYCTCDPSTFSRIVHLLPQNEVHELRLYERMNDHVTEIMATLLALSETSETAV